MIIKPCEICGDPTKLDSDDENISGYCQDCVKRALINEEQRYKAEQAKAAKKLKKSQIN